MVFCESGWIWNAYMMYGCWPEITLDHTEKRVVLQFRSLFPGDIRKWCRTLSSTQNAERHWCDYVLWCLGDSSCLVVFFSVTLKPSEAGSLRLLRRFHRITLNQTLEQICGKRGEVHHLIFIFAFFFFFCSLKKVSKERPTYTELMVSVSVLTDYKHDFPASTL